MPNHGGWWRHPVLVPLLLILALGLSLAVPSPLWVGLLLVSVIRAARQWPGRIAWGVAGISVLLLGLLLWQLTPRTVMTIWAFVWLGVALLVLAGTLGYATQRARTFAQYNRELKEAQERLDALYQIAMAISSTLEPGGVLAAVLDRLGALGYDALQVFLQHEEGGEFVAEAQRGTTRLPAERIMATMTKSNLAMRTEPFVVRYEEFLSAFVPLVYEGDVMGLLYVERSVDDGFTESDLHMLHAAAKGASARLVNAQLYAKTRLLAITDPITGLFNYRHYQENVSQHLRDSQLSGVSFALLMIDLDHFKHCNDTYGHVTGDAVLRQVAAVLRDSTRSGDLCFRYGGEEFTVLLPTASREQATWVAERIRSRVHEHQFLTSSGRPIEIPMSVSIGVVAYPDDGLTDGDLILAADKAMYRAKASGRDRVVAGGDVVSSAS